MSTVCVNARFRWQQTTGVQRYADAVLRRLPECVETVMPTSSYLARGMAGHFWEQVRLPSRVGRRLLWSPCNTGPLRVRRQVITVHDAAFLDCPQFFSKRFASWYGWMLPRLVKGAVKILTVSRFSAQRLKEHFRLADDKVVIACNAIDERFRPAGEIEQDRVRSQYLLPSQFALTVGSLDPRKNLQATLRAWQTTPALREVPLVIAGGGSPIFRSALRESLPRWVRLLGYVPDELLPGLYSAASVFVFSSLYEGFGLPPLESMACGTPTVCSCTSSLPEVVGDAALLVDPYDPSSIGDAVTRVLSDAETRERLSAAGRRRATFFDWKVTAAKVWDVLRQAA